MSHIVEKTWITEVGLRACCLAVHGMHRCGYVAVPNGHPLYGINYSSEVEVLRPLVERVKQGPIGKRGIIPIFLAAAGEGIRATPELIFDVHGGVTFSGGDGKYPVPGSDLWWFGFDCGHDGDANLSYPELGGELRDMEYVTAECESLAKQLAGLDPAVTLRGDL